MNTLGKHTYFLLVLIIFSNLSCTTSTKTPTADDIPVLIEKIGSTSSPKNSDIKKLLTIIEENPTTFDFFNDYLGNSNPEPLKIVKTLESLINYCLNNTGFETAPERILFIYDHQISVAPSIDNKFYVSLNQLLDSHLASGNLDPYLAPIILSLARIWGFDNEQAKSQAETHLRSIGFSDFALFETTNWHEEESYSRAYKIVRSLDYSAYKKIEMILKINPMLASDEESKYSGSPFPLILKELSIEEQIEYLIHPAEAVRMAASRLTFSEQSGSENLIKDAYKNGSPRMKLSLYELVQHEKSDPSANKLLKEIINNGEYPVFYSDISRFNSNEINDPDLSPSDLISACIRILNNPSHAERNSAIVFLQQFGEDAAPAVPALIKSLDIETDRFNAIVTLGKIGVKASDAIPTLLEIKSGDDITNSLWAACSLYLIGHEKDAMTEFIVSKIDYPESLQSDDFDQKMIVLENITDILGEIGHEYKPATDFLLEFTRKGNVGPAERAINSLEKIQGKDEAIEVLLDNLKSDDPIVRLNAVKFMSDSLGNYSVRSNFLKMINDPSPSVSVNVLKALLDKRIDVPDKIPALLAVIAHPQSKESEIEIAAVLLGKIGPDANEAVPILLEKFRTNNQLLLNKLIKSIHDIGGTNPQILSRLLELANEPDSVFSTNAVFGISLLAVEYPPALESLRRLSNSSDDAVAKKASDYYSQLKGVVKY